MANKLGFKDFLSVDYAPGMPDEIKHNAKKRKTDDVEEALTPAQRRQRGRIFKKFKARIKIGQERAKRKIASPEKLKARARKAARNAVLLKLTKDIPKSELNFARRQELEKRLDKPAMKRKIDMLAKRMLPKVRKAELERKRGAAKKK